MYFSHQPSGGRGEYELAGEINGVSAGNLTGAQFRIDAGVFGVHDAQLVLTAQGGKHRVRTTNNVPHVQRQVAALLMLPESTRDVTKVSGGLPVAISKRYLIDEIHVVSLAQAGAVATVGLGNLVLRSNLPNQPVVAETVDFGLRIARVRAVHDKADELPEPLKSAVESHRDEMAGNGPIVPAAERAVRDIMAALDGTIEELGYAPRTDPLPWLEAVLGIAPTPVPPPPTDTAADEVDIKRREASTLRLRRARVASASKFRREVQLAYGHRCLFCGLRLPKGEHCSRSGVDAAHILPYGQFDLDVVQNGIPLCKLHHWAFDEQLLVLRYDAAGDVYLVEVSARGMAAFANDPATLAALQAVAGPVPNDRLPQQLGKRPKPEYLDKFYADVPPV